MNTKHLLTWIKDNIIYTVVIILLVAALPIGAYSYNSYKYKQLVASAEKAMKEGNFDEATRLYNDALRFGKKDSMKITEDLDLINQSKSDKAIIDYAEEFIKDKKYLEALNELKRIEGDSYYYEIASVKAEKAKSSYISENLEKAKTEAELSKYNEAIAIIDTILSIDNVNKEAEALKKNYYDEVTKIKIAEEETKKKAEEEKHAVVNNASTSNSGSQGSNNSPVNINYVYGNSSGNILNSGLSAADNQFIYFGKPNDNYKLYKMKLDGSGISKVSEVSGTSKSIIGDWIYYCNPKMVQESGIYKVKKDGSSKTKITGDGAMFINVVGDWIYYTSSQNGETAIYKIKTDGTGKVKINIGDKNFVMATNEEFVVVGDYIYCNLNAKNEGSTFLVRMKNDGSSLSKLSNASQHFAINNGYIYYISSNYQEIWKMKTDGSSKTLVYKVTNHFIYSINAASNNIYFSADNQTAELQYVGIYKMNLDGSGLTRIYNNFCKKFSISADWIFFDGSNKGTMRIKTDGSQLSEL